jgi:hypothetical protein
MSLDLSSAEGFRDAGLEPVGFVEVRFRPQPIADTGKLCAGGVIFSYAEPTDQLYIEPGEKWPADPQASPEPPEAWLSQRYFDAHGVRPAVPDPRQAAFMDVEWLGGSATWGIMHRMLGGMSIVVPGEVSDDRKSIVDSDLLGHWQEAAIMVGQPNLVGYLKRILFETDPVMYDMGTTLQGRNTPDADIVLFSENEVPPGYNTLAYFKNPLSSD